MNIECDESGLSCDECKRPCHECPVGKLWGFEQMEIIGNGRPQDGWELFYKIVRKMDRARQLHPVFATGKWQGLGRISAEVGELVRAIEKDEGQDREKAEILDSIIVLIRYWMGEYEVDERGIEQC